jgi:hypothetical protein
MQPRQDPVHAHLRVRGRQQDREIDLVKTPTSTGSRTHPTRASLCYSTWPLPLICTQHPRLHSLRINQLPPKCGPPRAEALEALAPKPSLVARATPLLPQILPVDPSSTKPSTNSSHSTRPKSQTPTNSTQITFKPEFHLKFRDNTP